MKIISNLSIMMVIMEVFMCASIQSQVTKDTPGWFEFVIPGLDATQTPIDMSFLNPKPAGDDGFVRIEKGHFVDGAGKPLRFLGTNLTFSSAFPDKDVSPKLAAHLRKLGVNVVRFHHMDNGSNPRGIWNKEMDRLDPIQLDKLDWIIYQFKQNGIYTNINLHVSRNYPGLPRDISRTFNYGKSLDHFYRPFIEMQKEYARDLLTHKNPYTGTDYTEEPAVAFVEINNENTLVQNWNALMELPDPFKSSLLEQWRDWLKNHYHNTEELKAKWGMINEPLEDELLANGDFSRGSQGWSLQASTSSEGNLQVIKDGPKPDENALLVTTTKQGENSWDLQLHKTNLTLINGAPYTLSFQAKSDVERNVNLGLRLQTSPWRFLGLQKTIRLRPQWQEFKFVFQAQDAEPGLSRLEFEFRNQIGQFWFANISLKRGGNIGLSPDQSLEENNIPLITMDAPENMRKDFWNFLFDTEMNYSREMVKFLKDDLNVKAFVSVTQASYGGISGVYREGILADYTDMHSYWQHPRFPNIPWSRTDWDIPNTSMVRDQEGGTLTRLAIHRVNGKPFTVSEYDHPAPNFYTAEMFPMLASYAAFQDWDGLYQFDYGGDGWDRRRISGFFSMNGHPGKLAFLPVAAVMFRMNGVSAGTNTVLLYTPAGDIVSQLTLHGTSTGAIWRSAGMPSALPVMYPVAVEFRDGVVALSEKVADVKWVSSTEQIAWDNTDPKTALYTVNSPAVRAAIGYLGGRSVTLGDIKIEMPSTDTNWASIAMAALDGKPLSESGKILLVAAGRVENTNMGWNETKTSVSDKWGTEPTVAEGVPATITFTKSEKLNIQALDGTGGPKGEVICQVSDEGVKFTIGPQYETLWYLITKP